MQGPRELQGARVGGAIGTIVLVAVACYHGFTYAFGGSAGGRFGKHDVAPHRLQNLLGLGVAVLLMAIFITALKLLSVRGSPSQAGHRVGILYAALAFLALLLTGRLS